MKKTMRSRAVFSLSLKVLPKGGHSPDAGLQLHGRALVDMVLLQCVCLVTPSCHERTQHVRSVGSFCGAE